MNEEYDGKYIVIAYRYGESAEGYLIGWETDLEKAKQMADWEYDQRGGMKYSGVVFSMEVIDGMNQFVEIYRKGM